MPGKLTHNQYGKGGVRVSKIKRTPGNSATGNVTKHEFVEAAIDVILEGNFSDTYLTGDNRLVVATDSIRNTIYIKAHEDPWHSIESFGLTLARHFVETYKQVSKATVTLREHVWTRIGDAPAAFTGSDNETPTAVVSLERGKNATVESGIDQLMIAKTTDSAFKDFVNDEFRTLPDAEDRIFATVLTTSWKYDNVKIDFAKERAAIRAAMLQTFANHMSLSVQQSIHLLGQSALDASRAVKSITLTMPNKHHLKFNLAPFHKQINNEIFHVTSEPYGWINGTVERT